MKYMQNSILKFILVGFFVMVLPNLAKADCRVTTANDDSSFSSFRYNLEDVFDGPNSNCGNVYAFTPDSGPFDEVISFSNQLTANSTYPTLRTLHLNSPLVINSNTRTLVIGNISTAVVNDTRAEVTSNITYDAAYRTAAANPSVIVPTSMVYLDGASLGANVHPLQCAANQNIQLRNMAIITNGISHADFFSQRPCLHNAGAVYVCPSGAFNTAIQPGQAGWCGNINPLDTDGDGDQYCDDDNNDGVINCPTGRTTEDCDDTNPNRNPGATEICDMIDNDCDMQIDEGGVCTPPVDPDRDGDGFPDCTDANNDGRCDNDGDPRDCNDNDPNINPNAPEICGDGIDQNCDGVDSSCPPTPRDTDGDGDGFCNDDNGDGVIVCPGGNTTPDCNDNNSVIYPGALDIPNDGIAQNCTADVTCQLQPAPVIRSIAAGQSAQYNVHLVCTGPVVPMNLVTARYPASVTPVLPNPNTIVNGQTHSVSYNTRPTTPVGTTDIVVAARYTGNRVCAPAGNTNSLRGRLISNPLGPVMPRANVALQACTQRDFTLAGTTLIINGVPQTIPYGDVQTTVRLQILPGQQVPDIDDDGDGFCDDDNGVPGIQCPSDPTCIQGVNCRADCDDTPIPGVGPQRSPGLPEICADLIDNNCNGQVDEGCLNPPDIDNDGDGFCDDDNGVPGIQCETGDNRPDCDDNNPLRSPGLPEIPCDGIDNDCNGGTEDNPWLYEDKDSDFFGDPRVNFARRFCSTATPADREGYVPNDDDCDDTDRYVNPARPEICSNLRDDNCNGQTDEVPACIPENPDIDNDDYCDENVTYCPPNKDPGDCNDLNRNINPGAQEICADNVDNDCDGLRDEGCDDRDDDGDGFCDDDNRDNDIDCPNGNDTPDCDDTDPNVNPGAQEMCVGDQFVGNNCDPIDNIDCQLAPGGGTGLGYDMRGSGCSLMADTKASNSVLPVWIALQVVALMAVRRLRAKKFARARKA